jgi:hypothetical protein
MGFDQAEIEQGQRHAYIQSLSRHLHDTKMSKSQIDRIVTPLQRAAEGHGDWGRTLSHAGELARKYSDKQGQDQKGHLNIPETRKLLSGKSIDKQVNLEKAFLGTAKQLGNAFTPGF